MDQVELSGLFPGRDASFVAIAIDYCQQDRLEEGQECVDRQIVDEKFNLSEIRPLTAEKYIDYDDIDDPLKSYLKIHVTQQIEI